MPARAFRFGSAALRAAINRDFAQNEFWLFPTNTTKRDVIFLNIQNSPVKWGYFGVREARCTLRAGEFLCDNPDIHSEINEECRLCACGVMHNHSLPDHDEMTPEELIFKDADTLDRYRFSAGPDWRFMRLESSKEVASISYTLASLSNFLIANGCKRTNSVIDTAEMLGLMRKE